MHLESECGRFASDLHPQIRILDATPGFSGPFRTSVDHGLGTVDDRGEIRDLLSKQAHNRLDLKEDPQCGVYVRDLTSYVVKTTRECDKLRDFGAKNRHTGATAMNQDSSRSHSIYTITVESCETRSPST